MSKVLIETGGGSPGTDGVPVTVECSPTVLGELCADAVDGLYRLRRGGVEIGGVLFGTRDGNSIRITAYRPLPCEHAYGPSFLLSEKDRAGLDDLLRKAEQDPALKNLTPTGWYYSRTRSELNFSDQDLELHRTYFPETWQIAIVIGPSHFGACRVSVFAPTEETPLGGGSPRQELTVMPAKRSKGAAAERSREPGPHRPSRIKLPSLPGRPVAKEPEQEEILTAPAFVQMPSRFSWRWVRIAGVLVVLGLAIFGVNRYVAFGSRQVKLQVLDADGQLFIEWDRNSAPVRQADRATLEIRDGAVSSTIPLDRERIQLGSVTYKRRSDDVDIRLRIAGPSQHNEYVRFIGQPVPYTPTAQEVQITRERDQLRSDLENLRMELKLRDAQIRALARR